MSLFERFRRLTFWNKVGFMGAIASIVGLVYVALPLGTRPSGNIEGDPTASTSGEMSPAIAINAPDARVSVTYTDTALVDTDDAPDTCMISDGHLEAYTRTKKPLPVPPFSVPVAAAAVVDLDGDGNKVIVVGLGGWTEEETGGILALGHGGVVLWQFKPENLGRNYPKWPVSGKLQVGKLLISDLLDGHGKEIVALYTDGQGWYASCVALLGRDGTLLGSYWHPGHLHTVCVGSPTQGKPQMIIVGGVNNWLTQLVVGGGYLSCILMLDPSNLSGEAPPYIGKSSSGSHKWYGSLIPLGTQISHIDILDADNDGNNEVCLWTANDIIFYLNFRGEVVSRALGDAARGNVDFVRVQ